MDPSLGLERALEMVVKSEISPTDVKFLSEFNKTRKYFLWDKCSNLLKQIKLTLDKYQ